MLRVLATLVEALSSIPITHFVWLTISCNSSSKGSRHPLLVAIGACTHRHKPTHVQVIKNKIYLLKKQHGEASFERYVKNTGKHMRRVPSEDSPGVIKHNAFLDTKSPRRNQHLPPYMYISLFRPSRQLHQISETKMSRLISVMSPKSRGRPSTYETASCYCPNFVSPC